MPVQSGCLFCSEDEPCAAHADKGKPKSKRKPIASAPSASTPVTTTTGEPTTSPDWLKPAPKKFEVAAARMEQVEQTQDELLFREAIRNLAPILSKQTLRKYDHLINPPKDARLSKLGADVRRSLGTHQQHDA